MDSKKRAAPASTNTGSNSKKQATLLSMFKPINTKKATGDTKKEDNTTTDTNNEDTDIVTESSPELAREILSDLDDEKKQLLNLEMNTMHHEWLKVLKPELTKPYFLKVKEKNSKKHIHIFIFQDPYWDYFFYCYYY